MKKKSQRSHDRRSRDLRPVSFELHAQAGPAGSVIVAFGGTRVLCSVSVEDGVPPFLRGKGEGWLTADYSMLPGSSERRIARRVSGRSQEIGRLIGRSLRAAVDRSLLGERTFHVDCDVIEADGGTRTAAVTGAWVALALAVRKLRKQGLMRQSPLIEQIAAVSVGLGPRGVLVDLDYPEDSSCRADVNVVGTASGGFVEVQGTAERGVIEPKEMTRLLDAARSALGQLFEAQNRALSRR